MCQVQLSFEDSAVICHAIKQAKFRLLDIEESKLLPPTQYAARLSWQVLYKAREIIHMTQRTIARKPQKCVSPSGITLPIKEFLDLAYLIEQVMINLQKIEIARDIVSMREMGRQCQQALEGCLSGAWNRQSPLLVADY